MSSTTDSQTHSSPLNVTQDLGIEGKVSTSSIIKFVDNSVLSTQAVKNIKHQRVLPKCPPGFGDINDIFKRPIQVFTQSIGVANTGHQQTFDITNYWSNVNLDCYMNKFYAYRCNVVYRITVNASPTCTGRLIMLHAPYVDDQTTPNGYTPNISAFNATQLTSYPYVLVDLGTGETIDFKIPYCSPAHYIDTTNSDSKWSTVLYGVLTSFGTTTSSETADVTIFMWLEDMELYLPKGQSGNDEVAHTTDSSRVAPSHIMNSISSGLEHMSDIPVIGDFAKPLSWVSHIASKGLSVIGFSKPESIAPRTTTSLIAARGFTNVRGVDQSISLSLDPENSIRPDPSIVSVASDDMDIFTLLSRPQIYAIDNWVYNTPTTTPLLTQQIGPSFFSDTVLKQISSYFRFWSGSFILTIDMVKNAFYSGRLAIKFFPLLTAVDPNATNIPTIIVDVKSNKKISVRIPYVNLVPLAEQTASIGTLVIYPVNQLRAPDNVPQSITMLYSISIDKDFGLACPMSTELVQIAQMDNAVIHTNPQDPIGGEKDNKIVDILDIPISNPNIYTSVCGELVTNFRSFLQRSRYYGEYTLDAGDQIVIPYNDINLVGSADMYYFLSRFYRLQRGSRKFKIFCPAGSSCYLTVTLVMGNAPATNQGITNVSTVGHYDFEPQHFIRTDRVECNEITMPFYSALEKFPLSLDFYTQGIYVPQIVIKSYGTTESIDLLIYHSIGEDFSFGFPGGCPFLA